MHAMRTRTNLSAQGPRLSSAMILSIGLAVLLVSGCGNHPQLPATSSDVNTRSQQIQNAPNLTPEQKQRSILEMKVRTGQLPPSSLANPPQ